MTDKNDAVAEAEVEFPTYGDVADRPLEAFNTIQDLRAEVESLTTEIKGLAITSDTLCGEIVAKDATIAGLRDVLISLDIVAHALKSNFPRMNMSLITDPITKAFKTLKADTPASPCEWKYDEDHCKYDTSCGEAWSFIDDGIEENGVKYCFKCGKPVIEHGLSEIKEGDVFLLNENDDEWYDYVEDRNGKLQLHKFYKSVTDMSLLDAIRADNCRVIGNYKDDPELIKKCKLPIPPILEEGLEDE
jgi:hypothetical protein